MSSPPDRNGITAAAPPELPPLKHWRLEMAADLATLTLDVAGQSANVLSREVLGEFEQALREIERQPLQGLIICSGKPSGFIAGADVREFERISDPARAAELARGGSRVLERLAALPFPSAAAIHGFCLGGGLELALACTYRIARDDAATRLGLPEVRLGIHPGFSGTLRLPPLIGDLAALDLMLSGRTCAAAAARRLGLVDAVVPERYLRRAAEMMLRRRPIPRRAAWNRRLVGAKPLRALTARAVAARLRRKVDPDHYPAPFRILELWRTSATAEQEALSIGDLLLSRSSRNLVHVFLLGEELKRRGRHAPHGITRVHVVGAGVMGADIAMWAASKGFIVSLQDQKPEILARAVSRARGFFARQLKDARAVQAAMDRLMPDLAGDGLVRADLVIEAIVEQADPKRALLAAIERRVGPETLLASNTSSIPLETLADSLRDPARLVGLHFFNPVAKMQLVEVVRGVQTSEPTLARARAWTVAIDRLPLDVKSSPGFLVNRIVMPYLIEAMQLAEEGVPLDAIDHAARKFGMPVGPVELADAVGLDVCLAVAEELSGPLAIDVPARLRALVGRGRLGKKSGQGFYDYNASGRRVGGRGHAPPDMPITERLILRMLNEAIACLREGVVGDADAVDAGMVYGIGFAPYLGGPMRYIDNLGEADVRHNLYRLAQIYGKRFEPDPGWAEPRLRARPPAGG